MERIGPYEPLDELGRGGMGVVLRARCTRSEREVALKLLQVAGAGPDDVARFEREVQALVRLRHAAIVAVLDAGRSPRGPWVAMELIEGESLHARLRRDGPLEPVEATKIARTLCDALEHAHGMGVLHRDLKPHNVLLARDGRVVLVDFGLARVLGRESRLTLTGELLGTPCYMAPEQADARPCGPPADVYGLGATLYEALTAEPPFRGKSVVELLNKVASVVPPRPDTLRPGVPRELSDLVMRCLDKDPERRPAIPALGSALGSALDGAPRSTRRARVRLPVALAALLSGVAFGIATEVQARGAARALDEATREVGRVDVAMLMMRGRAQLRLEDASGALASATAALARDTGDVSIFGLRAGALFLLGRRDDALADCRRIAGAGTDEGVTLVNGSLVAAKCGDLVLARTLVERALRLDPRSALATRLLFDVLVKSGHADEAATFAERALGEDRLSLEGTLYLLDALADLRPASAVTGCERATIRWPDDARLWIVHAQALEKSGDLTRALDLWSEVLERWPGHLGAQRARPRLWLLKRDPSRASEEAERLVERVPQDPGAWELLAAARERQGEWAAADVAVSRMIALRPEEAKLYVRRAEVRKKLGRMDSALLDLAVAIAIEPTDGTALAVRSAWAAQAGDFGAAIADLERAVDLQPTSGSFWLNLANTRRYGGKLDDALTAANRAVELLPGRYEVFLIRAEVHLEAGRRADARVDYERVLTMTREPQVQGDIRRLLDRLPP